MGRKPNPSRTQPQSFFKVMIGDFSNHLLIPPAFAKHVVDGVFPREFVLRTRDGRDKRVSMIKVKNGLFFKGGWSNFVEDKSIDMGDFLVFDNVGNFKFNVSIYKRRTGCEEEVTVAEEERNLADSDSDFIFTSDDIEKFKQSRAKVPEAMRGKARAVEAANKFNSKLPFFKVTMSYSYIYRSYLHLPATFFRKYLKMKPGRFMLQVSNRNRSWPVKFSIHGDRFFRLSTGWTDFVKDNTLQEDDVCVFELIKGKETVLKMSIFRCNG